MLDGVKGRDSGVLILHDGTWKGELRTNQHARLSDPLVRPLSGGKEVASGFSGTFAGD
jgi:hypothetical protein